MLSNSVQLDIRSMIRSILRSDVKLPHSRHNSVKISSRLFCWKCIEDVTPPKSPGRKKSFNNCSRLYQHLVSNHNGLDRVCSPSLEICLEVLQFTSDLISLRLLK